MNLFYEKASEAFADENIVSNVCIKSPLELVGEKFTRQELYDAISKCGKKTKGAPLIRYYEKNRKIKRIDANNFQKVSG